MRIPSFQGVKNIGCQTYIVDHTQCEIDEKGRMVLYPKTARTDFRAELTNENGNHLEKCQNLLKKYPNKDNPNVMHITKLDVIDDFNNKTHTILTLNNKDIKLQNNTLHDFINMFNVLKYVQETIAEKMPLESKYVNSMEPMNSFIFYTQFFMREDERGKRHVDPAFLEMLDVAHHQEWVKKGAEAIKDTIAKQLDYFFKNE